MPSLMWRTASAIATSRLLAHDGREALLGRGELHEVERARCSWNHAIEARMPSSMRRTGSGSVADRGLLAAAEVLVRTAEQLDEELLLAREVPVEDALADAEAGDDVGDRGGVVAALGEEPRRLAQDLRTAGPAPLRQLPRHRVTLRVASTERSIRFVRRTRALVQAMVSRGSRVAITCMWSVERNPGASRWRGPRPPGGAPMTLIDRPVSVPPSARSATTVPSPTSCSEMHRGRGGPRARWSTSSSGSPPSPQHRSRRRLTPPSTSRGGAWLSDCNRRPATALGAVASAGRSEPPVAQDVAP